MFYIVTKRMPYLCGFWRFANAYELVMQKGAYQLLIGKGVSEDTLVTVLRAMDHA